MERSPQLSLKALRSRADSKAESWGLIPPQASTYRANQAFRKKDTSQAWPDLLRHMRWAGNEHPVLSINHDPLLSTSCVPAVGRTFYEPLCKLYEFGYSRENSDFLPTETRR